MKLQRFNFLNLAGLFILIGILSSSFYTIERNGMLNYLADGVNQSLFRLEGDLQKTLQQGHLEDVQALLDQGSAINSGIRILSLSVDGHTIAVSSSRSLNGKVIEGEYLPLTQIATGLVKNESLQY